MTDPQTTNLGLYQPTRGSDPGTWDQPVNANTWSTDSLFTNVAGISLTNTNVTLTTPPNSGALWSGPYQSQSALLRLTGTLTASAVAIVLPRPGYYMVENLCLDQNGFSAGAVTGSNVVVATNVGATSVIGIPPNRKQWIFYDGTNLDYVGLEQPGTRVDIHGLVALPSWMAVCTVQPYLIRDGTVYLNSAYPALSSVLRNAFGGTSGLSFAVPDSLARIDVPFDTKSTGRVTAAFSASTMGASGGLQTLSQAQLPAVALAVSITANQWSHTHTGANGFPNFWTAQGGSAGTAFSAGSSCFSQPLNSVLNPTLGGATSAMGSGAGFYLPGITSHLPLIKT